MEYKGSAKYIRTSPRKLRLVADVIRSRSCMEAEAYLNQCKKRSARPISKLLESVKSNAKRSGASFDSLFVKKIEVGEGPVMKRWRAISRGQAHPYKKRMSHVSLVLSEKEKAKIQKDQAEKGGAGD